MCVQPGEDGVAAVTPPADIRITNIALSDQIADESGRTTVKLNYIIPSADDSEEEDEEDDEDDEDEKPPRMMTTVLCSLTPGKVCSIYVPIFFHLVINIPSPAVFVDRTGDCGCCLDRRRRIFD